MADWKDTLNLPRTEFPMKANLPMAEPEALAESPFGSRDLDVEMSLLSKGDLDMSKLR